MHTRPSASHPAAMTRGFTWSRRRRELRPFSHPARNAASGARTQARAAPGMESAPLRSSHAVPVAMPTIATPTPRSSTVRATTSRMTPQVQA